MLLPPTHAQVTGRVYEQLSTLGLPNCLERRLRAPAEAEQAGTGQAQNRRGCRDKKPRRMGPHPAYPRPIRRTWASGYTYACYVELGDHAAV